MNDLDVQTAEEIAMVIDTDKMVQGIQMLNDTLERHIVTLTFTKADGSDRTMKCTKNFRYVPIENQPVPLPEGVEKAIMQDTQLFKVYDLEKHGWRSFYYTTVKTMKVESQ